MKNSANIFAISNTDGTDLAKVGVHPYEVNADIHQNRVEYSNLKVRQTPLDSVDFDTLANDLNEYYKSDVFNAANVRQALEQNAITHVNEFATLTNPDNWVLVFNEGQFKKGSDLEVVVSGVKGISDFYSLFQKLAPLTPTSKMNMITPIQLAVGKAAFDLEGNEVTQPTKDGRNPFGKLDCVTFNKSDIQGIAKGNEIKSEIDGETAYFFAGWLFAGHHRMIIAQTMLTIDSLAALVDDVAKGRVSSRAYHLRAVGVGNVSFDEASKNGSNFGDSTRPTFRQIAVTCGNGLSAIPKMEVEETMLNYKSQMDNETWAEYKHFQKFVHLLTPKTIALIESGDLVLLAKGRKGWALTTICSKLLKALTNVSPRFNKDSKEWICVKLDDILTHCENTAKDAINIFTNDTIDVAISALTENKGAFEKDSQEPKAEKRSKKEQGLLDRGRLENVTNGMLKAPYTDFGVLVATVFEPREDENLPSVMDSVLNLKSETIGKAIESFYKKMLSGDYIAKLRTSEEISDFAKYITESNVQIAFPSFADKPEKVTVKIGELQRLLTGQSELEQIFGHVDHKRATDLLSLVQLPAYTNYDDNNQPSAKFEEIRKNGVGVMVKEFGAKKDLESLEALQKVSDELEAKADAANVDAKQRAEITFNQSDRDNLATFIAQAKEEKETRDNAAIAENLERFALDLDSEESTSEESAIAQALCMILEGAKDSNLDTIKEAFALYTTNTVESEA